MEIPMIERAVRATTMQAIDSRETRRD